jgi:hypothetical protein
LISKADIELISDLALGFQIKQWRGYLSVTLTTIDANPQQSTGVIRNPQFTNFLEFQIPHSPAHPGSLASTPMHSKDAAIP